jgi:hypothetical protein
MRKKATRKPRSPRPPRSIADYQTVDILGDMEDEPEPDTCYGGW